MNDKVIALDLAKNIFHAVVFCSKGKEIERKKLRRSEVVRYVINKDASTVVFEACGSSHYFGRVFKQHSLKVVLLPPQHVKAYLRGQKNDYNDARAIGEAYQHGKVRPVAIKSKEQQTDQAFLRIRRMLVDERGDIARQIRGFLFEFGIVIATGISSVRRKIPEILEDGDNELTIEMRELLYRQYQRLLVLDEELKWYEKRLKEKSKQDKSVERLVSLPGFGSIVATAFKGWIGDGKQFSKGRDASAALGVVPKQHSSGGRDVLLGITKRGDCYLRSLIIHGARSVVRAAKNKTDKLSVWINGLVERRGKNRATVALANKLIRIAWAIVVKEEHYQC